jgi:putative chitinase
MINKAETFKNIRLNFGKLSQKQVEGFDQIFNSWDELKEKDRKDKRHLAYMLATAWHETAKTMQPIAEYGKGKTRVYGKRVKHSGILYSDYSGIFYGRGYVQLTWYENYQLMGRLLGLNLLAEPELAMNPYVASRIMFEGMLRGSSSVGDFTGKCLEMYFNEKTEDPINARRIINGLDCAELIKKYYDLFVHSIE